MRTRRACPNVRAGATANRPSTPPRRDVGEERALEAVSALQATTIEPVAEEIALEAADLALEHRLAIADAIILATARRYRADIITGDADFEGLLGVTVIR